MKWIERMAGLFDRPLSIGTVLAERYTIRHVIGMGSYGFTYVVYDQRDGQEKAMKQLRRSKQRTANGVKSFQKEQAILAALHHSAIPRLLDSFTWQQKPFFVMEYIRGKTFEQLIFEDKQVYGEAETFSILYSLLSIVSHFHTLGIVHRDLRIPNILLHNDSLHIIDFGLARHVGERDERERSFSGEQRFMREVHYRSDFYALGHFALFLLYSAYVPDTKQERPWYEELSLSPSACFILMRMLQIETPYEHVRELMSHIEMMKRELTETCSKEC